MIVVRCCVNADVAVDAADDDYVDDNYAADDGVDDDDDNDGRYDDLTNSFI